MMYQVYQTFKDNSLLPSEARCTFQDDGCSGSSLGNFIPVETSIIHSFIHSLIIHLFSKLFLFLSQLGAKCENVSSMITGPCQFSL